MDLFKPCPHDGNTILESNENFNKTNVAKIKCKDFDKWSQITIPNLFM